jgi:hypothetical protein
MQATGASGASSLPRGFGASSCPAASAADAHVTDNAITSAVDRERGKSGESILDSWAGAELGATF